MKNVIFTLVIGCISLLAQGQSPADLQKAVAEGKASFLIINTTPAGANISVDGKPIAPTTADKATNSRTPTLFVLFKKDAPRTIVISLNGYKPVERHLDPNGSPIAIETTLEPLAKASSPASSVAVSHETTVAEPASSGPMPSPFGFRYGASKEEVIRQLGSSAVIKNAGIQVQFKTAPAPHSDFEIYTAFFSPTKGLLKVVAYSKDIATSDDGSELKAVFDALRLSLDSKYGKSQSVDNCKGDEVDCKSQFYMMELMQKNRELFALWSKTAAAPNTGIVLEGKALGINKGFVLLSYEFPGWDQFVDEQDNKKNSVF